MLVRHMMIKDFVSSKKDATIKDCINTMFEKHVGSVVITDVEQKCEGIFTERDAIRVISQAIALDTLIEKVMVKNVFTVSEDATFEDALHIIRERRVRHLPVTDSEGKIVGLMSIRHLFDELFEMT